VVWCVDDDLEHCSIASRGKSPRCLINSSCYRPFAEGGRPLVPLVAALSLGLFDPPAVAVAGGVVALPKLGGGLIGCSTPVVGPDELAIARAAEAEAPPLTHGLRSVDGGIGSHHRANHPGQRRRAA
jgi:hypothetical protein